jgi:hypothetical protein
MYAFTQDLPITTDVYARIMQGVGTAPPDGCVLHAVVRIDGGLRYIDIWESREACDRFLEERVHPVLQGAFSAAGATMPGEPVRNDLELVDLHVFPRTASPV